MAQAALTPAAAGRQSFEGNGQMGPAGSRRREGEGSTDAATADAADAGSAATAAATDTGSAAADAATDARAGSGGSGACGACAPDGDGHRARCPVGALRVPAHNGPFGRGCARLVLWLLPRERQG